MLFALKSIRLRIKAYRLGWYFFRWKHLKIKSRIRIRNQWIVLKSPAGEQSVQEHELGEILLHDRYQLDRFAPRANRILDVGANIGFFALAARLSSPSAIIHAYEPCPATHDFLRHNTKGLDIVSHSEAVGESARTVSMVYEQASLHSRVNTSKSGEIPQITLGEAVRRLGNQVDFLKLDCEGAEWGMLDSKDAWKNILAIGMEYHLWAKPGSTLGDLVSRLDELGYEVIETHESSPSWGMLFAIKKSA